MKKTIINSAKKTLITEVKGLKTLSNIFNNTFYNAVRTIYNTKGRVIVTGIGKSAHIGNKISATLSSTGTPSFFIHATEASHGDLGSIKRNDSVIAISNSGETNELSDIINYTKRYNIPLISITSNQKSALHRNSTYGILYKKQQEACPLNLAPTTSTTMTLVIGDCIAISLLEMRGFKQNQFKNFHPGGNIGKDLKKVSEIMHLKNKLPLAKQNQKMSKVLIQMTKKSFGCIGVINNNNNLIGIITDGDLRRNMDNKFLNKKAYEIMTKKPTIADKNLLVGEAINIMNQNKITGLFVCEKNKPIGIVHIHDLLRLSN
tara:strand:+ start:256 stop:1209 length:954 start_codon:yes stop_codon:yes gene_type:complete